MLTTPTAPFPLLAPLSFISSFAVLPWLLLALAFSFETSVAVFFSFVPFALVFFALCFPFPWPLPLILPLYPLICSLESLEPVLHRRMCADS